MEIYGSGHGFFVVLKKGEEILSSLKEFCISQNIDSGFISGIGAIEDFEIGAFDTKKGEYIKKSYKEPHELLSLTGNISKKEDGEFVIHLHCIAGDEEMNVFGGHLFKAKIAVTCEIFIHREELKLTRRFDRETNLYLIKKED